MNFELALMLYILLTLYLYNNFPEYVKKYSNMLPIIAILSYYIVVTVKV
jgi:hypothetical protein